MKKRFISLVLSLCMTVMLIPSAAHAEDTDWKDLYFDFLKNTVNKNQDSYYDSVKEAILADLNFDGTPELITHMNSITQSGCPTNVYKIVDDKLQLMYTSGLSADSKYYMPYDDTTMINRGYPFSMKDDWWKDIYENSIDHNFSLRKNKYTDELMYISFSDGGEELWRTNHFYIYDGDTTSEKFKITYTMDGDLVYTVASDNDAIISSECYIDSNPVSKEEYDTTYNEFLDTWEATGYELAYLDFNGKSATDQQIRDFLNSYVPEKEALGMVEDTSPQYGHVTMIPTERTKDDNEYLIPFRLTNNSSEKITNKRLLLLCTSITNTKTNREKFVVTAYLDQQEDFEPYQEQNYLVTMPLGKRTHTNENAEYFYRASDEMLDNYVFDDLSFQNLRLVVVQFDNDEECDAFLQDLKDNEISDLSNEEKIEHNAQWLKSLWEG